MLGIQPVFLFVLTAVQPGWIPPYLPSDAEVRRMLGALDNFDTGPQILAEYGAALFPAYSRLLRDNSLPVGRRASIFSIVARLNGDRGRFLEDAVAGLAHADKGVRRSAVYLLARIGSARDAAPVAVLLSDPDVYVAYTAAETLVAIGDRRALAAFDVWLASHPGRDPRGLREEYEKLRESLRQRLDAQPPLPTAPPPRPVVR